MTAVINARFRKYARAPINARRERHPALKVLRVAAIAAAAGAVALGPVAVLGYDLMLAVAGHAVVGTVTAKDDAARIAHYQYDGSTLGRAGPFHDAAAISRARLDALSVGDPLPAHAAGMFGLASSTVDRTPGEYLALRWHLILAATVVWGGAGVVGTYTYRLRRHIERQRRVVNATASTAAAAVA